MIVTCAALLGQVYNNTYDAFARYTYNQNEKQQIVDTGAPGNLPYAMAMFTDGFHMCVIPGTSWNANNCVGAGLFHCVAGCLPVLARMEISDSTSLYRITVRSPSPTLSAAVLALSATIFGKPTTL